MVKSQISSSGVQERRNLQGQKHKKIAKNFDLLSLKIRNGQIDAYCINMPGETPLLKLLKVNTLILLS